MKINKRTLLFAKEGLEELNLGKMLSVYDESTVFEDIPADLRIEDKAGLRSYYEKLFTSPGLGFSDIRIYEGEDFAVIEWILSGLSRVKSESFKVRGASVIELKEGKIICERIYYDSKPEISGGE